MFKILLLPFKALYHLITLPFKIVKLIIASILIFMLIWTFFLSPQTKMEMKQNIQEEIQQLMNDQKFQNKMKETTDRAMELMFKLINYVQQFLAENPEIVNRQLQEKGVKK